MDILLVRKMWEKTRAEMQVRELFCIILKPSRRSFILKQKRQEGAIKIYIHYVGQAFKTEYFCCCSSVPAIIVLVFLHLLLIAIQKRKIKVYHSFDYVCYIFTGFRL